MRTNIENKLVKLLLQCDYSMYVSTCTCNHTLKSNPEPLYQIHVYQMVLLLRCVKFLNIKLCFIQNMVFGILLHFLQVVFENLNCLYQCVSLNCSYQCVSLNCSYQCVSLNCSYKCVSLNCSYQCVSLNCSYECVRGKKPPNKLIG